MYSSILVGQSTSEQISLHRNPSRNCEGFHVRSVAAPCSAKKHGCTSRQTAWALLPPTVGGFSPLRCRSSSPRKHACFADALINARITALAALPLSRGPLKKRSLVPRSVFYSPLAYHFFAGCAPSARRAMGHHFSSNDSYHSKLRCSSSASEPH